MERRDEYGHITDEQLSGYLDGSIESRQEMELIRQHVAECAHCARSLEDLRTITVLLRELPEPTTSRSFRLSHDQVAERRRVVSTRLLEWQSAFRRTAAVAAVLLIAITGIGLIDTGTGDPLSGQSDMDTALESADSPDAGTDGGSNEESMAADEAAPESDGGESDDAGVPESDAAGGADEQIEENPMSDSDESAASDEEAAQNDAELDPEEPQQESDTPDSAEVQPESDSDTSRADEETAMLEDEKESDAVDEPAVAIESSDNASTLGLVQIALVLIVIWSIALGYLIPWILRRRSATLQ